MGGGEVYNSLKALGKATLRGKADNLRYLRNGGVGFDNDAAAFGDTAKLQVIYRAHTKCLFKTMHKVILVYMRPLRKNVEGYVLLKVRVDIPFDLSALL